MDWHECKRWTAWWKGTCPLAPLAWHVADLYTGGTASKFKDGFKDIFTEQEAPKPQLGYKVPTKDQEQAFARAAVAAAVAAGTHTAVGTVNPPRKQVGAEGWPRELEGSPVPKSTGLVGDATRVILALALSAVLTKGVSMLGGLGINPSAQVVGRIESLASQGFSQQLRTRGKGAPGKGFHVNFAGELRALVSGTNR